MVINLQFVPDLIVANVITKMTGLSFKNSCLSSKFINEIANKYRKTIKIWLPNYDLKLDADYWSIKDESDDDSVHKINIQRFNEKEHKILKFHFEYRPEEMFSSRPELQLFIFEQICSSNRSQKDLLQEFKTARMSCHTLTYTVPDEYFLQTIRILNPKNVYVPCTKKLIPSEIFDEESIRTLDHLTICVTTTKQIEDSIDLLTPRLRSLNVQISRRKLKVVPIVNRIKSIVERIQQDRSETVNQKLRIFCLSQMKVKLATITRPFLQIPHTSWKLEDEDDDEHTFFFINMADGSTLILYFAELFSISYQIASRIDQFYDFFANCRQWVTPLDIEEVFDTKKKKQQLNYIKQNCFPND